MRRKSGELVGVEQSILQASAQLQALGIEEVHGYALAKEMRDGVRARRLVAHGTLYKALDRLEGLGMLTSRWEEAEGAVQEGRPRRRLYCLTTAGAAAARLVPDEAPRPTVLREKLLPG